MSILKDVLVLDFSQGYSGDFCTMQLADFGARVIKIERKGVGDMARSWEPMQDGQSGYFAMLNRNKESLEVDFNTDEGITMIKKLIANADILVENYKGGTMEKWGLGYEDLREENKGLIYASLSGFGKTGSYQNQPAYENVIQAMSGIMEMTGFPEDAPVRVGPAIGDSLTALMLANGIVMAYYYKMQTGEGQRVDVAMLDTLFSIMESPVLFHSLKGMQTSRCGNNEADTLVPYDVYPCKDGYFSVGLASDAGWEPFCHAVGMPRLLEDERFADNALRCKNYCAFTKEMLPYFAKYTRSELQTIFTEAHIPNAPVLSVPEIMMHPQITDREMLVELNDEGIGKYRAVNNPMKLSKTPAEIRKGAPLLGQDTTRICKEFGLTLRE